MQPSLHIHAAPANGPATAARDNPGMDVLDAAYHTAYDYPGGVHALAPRMGVNANTLKHKLNPGNSTHHLTLREAVDMQALTGNAAILHAMAHELGYVCTLATPDASDGDPLQVLTALNVAVADLARALCDPLTRGQAAKGGAVTPNEMRRAEVMAQEAIAAIGDATAMLRGRMRAAPKVDY